MRTRYEIEDTDGYLAARELLLRRCGSWAAANDRALSLPLAGALLDSRHFSPDGRLGYWTPSQVRRALLDWIPGKVTAPQEDLLAAPETLRSLLRYLDATGLRDPRGAATVENEAAIDTAAKEFAAAIADEERYGVAKTMALSAGYGDAGIRLPDGLASFLQGIDGDLPAFNAAGLEDLLERQLMLPGLGHDRTYPQLPVRLPAREELAAAAEHSTVVGQFRALAEWLGPKGRALTPAKNIRPADARDLIALLGTGDEGLKFHSAAELPGLNLVVSWALKARLIRRQGARLLPVAKARPLLADAEALWQRAFEAAFDIGPAVCRPIWADEPPSPAQQMYDVIVPDLMATIYSMEEPVPVPRLAESVWESVKANFDLDFLSPLSLMGLRGRVDNDVEHIFDAFEALGAVTTVQGVASEIFSMDLGDGTTLPFGTRPFEPARRPRCANGWRAGAAGDPHAPGHPRDAGAHARGGPGGGARRRTRGRHPGGAARHGRRALHDVQRPGGDRHLAGRPRRLAGSAGAGGPRLPVPVPARGAADDPRPQRAGGHRTARRADPRPGPWPGRPARGEG